MARFILINLTNNHLHNHRVRVEFYNSENTLKEQLQLYLIKDHQVSFMVRSAKLILEVLACYLYVCRVIFDRGPSHATW